MLIIYVTFGLFYFLFIILFTQTSKNLWTFRRISVSQSDFFSPESYEAVKKGIIITVTEGAGRNYICHVISSLKMLDSHALTEENSCRAL